MEDPPPPTQCTAKDGTVYNIEEVYALVRGLLGNETLPQTDLIRFMRSEMFSELCPDLAEAFNNGERMAKERADALKLSKEEKKIEKQGESSKSVKLLNNVKKENNSEKVKVKKEPADDHKKQKVKAPCISSDSDSDVGARPIKQEKKKKHKKHKVRTKSPSISGSSSASLKSVEHKPVKKHKTDKNIKKENDKSKSKQDEEEKPAESGPKIHPFWLGKMGATVQTKGKLFQSKEEQDEEKELQEKKRRKRQHEESLQRKRQQKEAAERKRHEEAAALKRKQQQLARQPKPYSYYRKSASLVVKKNGWKPPQIDKEWTRMQNKHKLKPMSVLCVDLLKLEDFFHDPEAKGPPSTVSSIPLKRNMNISDDKGDQLVTVEKVKRDTYTPVLNKLYAKSLKELALRRASRDSSSDAEKDRREKKHHRRVVQSSSDSSSSDPIVPKKGAPNRNPISREAQKQKDKSSARKGTADYKAEQRKKQLELIKQKTENKFNNRGTRKLPWENQNYFDKKKQEQAKKDNAAKENEKKKLENRLKFLKKQHAPATPFQNILAQIEAANKEAAKKPPVALKIPKLSDRINREILRPVVRQITPSEVWGEVEKLLNSDIKIEVPNMPTSFGGNALSEYTIRKIAWWLLKNEKEPADEVEVHPELHDNEIYEPWYKPPEDGFESDTSSIGCVSDPEGVSKAEDSKNMPLRIDADVADEYCGLGSLQAKIATAVKDADVYMKPFFKVRPGTNYEKSNFEAKCYLCEEKVFGQRQLGAHIRSEHHKNQFLNYSLKLTNYEESCTPAVYQKYFKARLVEYSIDSADNQVAVSVASEPGEPQEEKIKKVEQPEPDIQQADSPRAVIDGEDETPNVVALDQLDIDLDLPSSDYVLHVDTKQLQAKIVLKRAGRWNDILEQKWVEMQSLQTKLTEKYSEIRDEIIAAANTHPRHDCEWNKFWERRCNEIEAEGKNPDDYDFSSEWEVFWLKRVQEIMREDAENEIAQMKSKFQLDYPSLLAMITKYGLKMDTEDVTMEPEKETSEEKSTTSKNQNPAKSNDATKPEVKPQTKYQETENSRPVFKERTPIERPAVKQDNLNINNRLLGIAQQRLESVKQKQSEKVIVPKNNGSEKENPAKLPSFIKKEIPVVPTVPKVDESAAVINIIKPTTTGEVSKDIINQIPDKEQEPKPVKKPVAPPPPKISDTKPKTERNPSNSPQKDKRSRSRDDKNHSRRDLRDELDDRRRDRNRDRKDSKDYKRTVSPEERKSRSRDYKNDRKRSRRSVSRERRDDKRRDRRRRSNSSSDYEREPKAKKSRELSADGRDLKKYVSPSLKERITSPIRGAVFQEKNLTDEQKDLNTLLLELEAAKQFEARTMITPRTSLDLGEVEAVSDSGEQIFEESPASPPINTSVIMDADGGIEERDTGPTEDYVRRIPTVATMNVPKGNETPEEGEIGQRHKQDWAYGNASQDSSLSSVSMGVDLNQVSTFIQNGLPGLDNFAKPKKKESKSANKDELADISDVSSSPMKNISQTLPIPNAPVIDFPSPTKLGANSIGFHLLTKPIREPGEIDDVSHQFSRRESRESRESRDSSKGRYDKKRSKSKKKNKKQRSREASEGPRQISERYVEDSFGYDPFANAEPPSPPPSSPPPQNYNRRKDNRRKSTENNKSHGQRYAPPSAPGPKCSKPPWARENRDNNKRPYKPLAPPPLPPSWGAKDAWHGESKEEEKINVFEDEDWEAEHPSAPIPLPPTVNQQKSKEQDDAAPYSPAWDEDSNDRLKDFAEAPASPEPAFSNAAHSRHSSLLPTPPQMGNQIQNLYGSSSVPAPNQYYSNNSGGYGAQVPGSSYDQNNYQNYQNQGWNQNAGGGNGYNNMNQMHPHATGPQQPQGYPPPSHFQQGYNNYWNTW